MQEHILSKSNRPDSLYSPIMDRTSTSDEIIKSCCLNASSIKINHNVDSFKEALKKTQLLTMLDKRWAIPFQSEANSNGYSQRAVLAFNDANSVLEADDFLQYLL
jgi:hypothetical protein